MESRSNMDLDLLELNDLFTVIETESPMLRSFVVASEYLSAKAPFHENGGSRTVDALANKRRRVAIDEVTGIWTVTVGSRDGWWSICLEESAFRDVLSKTKHCADRADSSRDTFAKKIRNAFERQSIMVGVKKSASRDANDWASIKLFIDLDDPVELKLDRLTDTAALARSTGIVLRAKHGTSKDSDRIKEAGILSLELHQLERKLEATQQALREERHKYRSLLAAPSAASARIGRKPVVGLGPRLGIGTQRSQVLPPSSPSTGSISRGGMSSSSSGLAPSSDDMFSVSGDSMRASQRSSQRTTSLVNPTRVRRADPNENAGFVGDDED